MGKLIFFFSVAFGVLFLAPFHGNSQTKETQKRFFSIGLSYGRGAQQSFPFNSEDYQYSYSAFRVLLNYRFSEIRSWKFEITAEPGIYNAQHQLLNAHYVQPRHGDDYLEQREWLTMEKSINEYAIDLGIVVRHQTFRNLSFFVQGSIGPMLTNRYTERMARGFAFSDIIAFGCSPRLGNLQIVLRTGVRHISNFNLQEPNSGYNAVLFDMGLTYNL